MSDTTSRSIFRIVFGLGLVGAGVLFTLSNLGMVDADQIVPWWPILLVLYGVFRIIGVWCRPALFPGIACVVIGSWWIMHNLGYLPFDIWQLWPLVFIFMGIGIMQRGRWGRSIAGIGYVGVSRLSRRRRRLGLDDATGADAATGASSNPGLGDASSTTPGGTSSGTASSDPFARGASHFRWSGAGAHSDDTDGVLRIDVLMSSITRTVSSQQFRGGEVVAVMGGAELDLRPARIENAVAQLEANLVMSGLTLFVPQDWVVEFHGKPLMGGYDDQTRRPAGEVRSRLIITGVVLLSGIVIKN